MDSGSDTSSDELCAEQFRMVYRRPFRPETYQQGAGAGDAVFVATPAMAALSPDRPSSPMSDYAQSQPPRPGTSQGGAHADAPMATERRSECGARLTAGQQPERRSPAPPLTLRPPYTVERIFDNYSKRRGALIRALTEDEEEFFQQCDPGMQPLYLHGSKDGTWEVKPPEVKLPTSEPEPAPGINIVRDTMERHLWLQQVARQSDAWLINISHFAASNLTATERSQLFAMIIDLPTILEMLLHHVEGQRSSGPNEANEVVEEQEEQRSSGPIEANEVLEETEEDASNDGDNFCASCGSRYKANTFWISCDDCGNWYHGKCVNITSSEAEHKEHYECHDCYYERVGWS